MASISVQAQTPALPGGPAPLPPGQVQQALNNPQIPSPAGGDLDQVRLQFPNSDIAPILNFYEQLTGKRIVSDNTVVGTININVTKFVSREEAIRIIETSLYINGFSLVPGEGDVIKLVGNGKNPRQFGVNIYSDVGQIPDGVAIASVVFQLEYADSKDMKTVVDQYLDARSIYTSSVTLPGAILITESAVMLKNIAKIIAAADVPPAEVVSRFYQLQRANAKDVVDKLNKLFEKSTQQTNIGGPSTAPGGRPNPALIPGSPAMPPGGAEIPASASGLTEDTIIVGKIKVDFDERTNRIHVVTRPVNLRFIEDLIAQYDSNIQFGEPVKRALKYVSASDVLSVIVKAITEPGDKPEGDTGGSSSSNSSSAQPTNNTTNQGINSNTGGGGGSGSGVNFSEGLSTPEKDITPKAVILGNTKIIADPRENTIIVLGNDEIKRKIFTLLDQLDVRAPQVLISTVIGEFTLNNDANFGVDYLLHYPSGPLANLLGSSGSTSTATTTTAGGLSTLAGGRGFGATSFTGVPAATQLASAVGAGSGFTAAIGAANSLDIIVNALESTGRFHVTNRPFAYTSNNKKAIIVSGQQIPYPANTLSNLNENGVAGSTAAVQSSVDFITVALQLEVIPLINSDREVTLDILQKLDSPSGQTQSIGGSNVPTISTRYIKTNVSVPNKSTIILGGLITKTVGGNNSQIPLLGKIPILGYIFGNKTKQSDRSELIILIRPVVTTNPDEMEDESHVERTRLLMEPDIDSTISPPGKHAAKSVNFHYQDATKVQ